MISFANKVVLVTGASSGIGAATAIKFVANEAKVAIVGRNEKKLKNIYKKCEELGKNKPLLIIADVSKDDEATKLVRNTVDHFGKLDVLVNNAGMMGGPTKILDDDAMQMYDRVISTNLRAAVYITKLAAPHLVKSKGSIINVSSVGSTNATSVNFPYCTSKAALDHFTRCMAFELGPKGVRVNVINPGPVRTDIFANVGPRMESRQDQMFETMRNSTVLGRISESEEIADLIFFLASDQAKGITGTSVICDNGFILRGSR